MKRQLWISLAYVILAGIIAGLERAVWSLYITGDTPAELEELGAQAWSDVLLMLGLFVVAWFAITQLLALLCKIPFRPLLIRNSRAFLSALVLTPMFIQDKYLLCQPRTALWMICLGLFAVVIRRNLVHTGCSRYPAISSSWLIGLLLFFVAACWAAGVFGPKRHPVGDEPSYLMITHSIAQDLDIKMNDDYHAKAYQRFYSGDYQMFTHLGYDGVNYPHHSIGLPVLLAPIYFVGLKTGSNYLLVLLVRLFMACIYSVLAVKTYHLLGKMFTSTRELMLIVLACFLSGPLFFFSFEIYPEILTALLLVLSIDTIFFPREHNDRFRKFNWPAVTVAVLPWLGIKYIPTAAVLFIICSVLIWRRTHRKHNFSVFLLPIALSGVIYLAYLYSVYHNINPTVIYTGVIPGTGLPRIRPGEPDFLASLPERIPNALIFWWGVLIEQRIGILIFNPIYLLIFPGIYFSLKSRHRSVYLAMLAIGGCHLFLYGWENNWGGYCPPNRQFVAVGPLLIPFVAIAWMQLTGKVSQWFKRLAISWGWLVALISVFHERWLYHTMNPHLSGGASNLLAAFSPPYGLQLQEYFPLLMGNVRNLTASVVWSIAFIILVTGMILERRDTGIRSVLTQKYLQGLLVTMFVLTLGFCWYSIPPGSYIKSVPQMPMNQLVILDDHMLGLEGAGFWVEGSSTTRLIGMFETPEPTVPVDLYALTPVRCRLDFGGSRESVLLNGADHGLLTMQPRRYFNRGDRYLLKMRVSADDGLRPSEKLGTKDTRFLGVFVKF